MMHVLLIEPDTTLREIYAKYLSNNEVEVACCGAAEEAVRLLDKQQSIDLIVLELQLANHNGLEFIYELRSYPEWQNIPIVLHTFVPPSSFKEYDTVTFKKLGIVDYVYKPATTLTKLLAVLQDAAFVTA